jgi:hypothetical protein
MTRAADITAGRCGTPCGGRWCVLRTGHTLGPGNSHRATPRTAAEAAAARAFAEVAGVREPPPHHAHASCRQEDPDLFFPDKPSSQQEEQAKEICARCLIRRECLQWALIHRIRYGVWGGAGEAERLAMLAGRAAGPASAAPAADPLSLAAAAADGPPGPESQAAAGRPGRITNPADRRHGTTERYASGPDENDVPGKPCRCRECQDAYNAARNTRTRLAAYGRWEPFVDAEPARKHAKALQDFGIGCGRIADLAGVSPSVVKALLYGMGDKLPSRVIRPGTRDRILAVQPVLDNLEDTVLVDPDPYRGQLRALIAAGWSPRYLAGRIPMDRASFYRVIGSQKQIAASTAKAVTRIHRELHDRQPPQRTAAERRAAETARSLARRHGWTGDQPGHQDPQPHQDRAGPDRRPPAEAA